MKTVQADHADLAEQLTTELERAEATISRLVALLLHAGAYDERLADDVIKEQS